MLGLGFILSFIILLYGVFKGVFIGYCLLASYLIFFLIALKMGYSLKHILKYSWTSGKKAFVVLTIFALIGLVTASWFSAGTIPAIVYYSMQVMIPKYFVVFAFLSSCLVSYMLGTALGTASTIGIVLIIMARTSDININLIGGAILAGCFFGDRTSPMSSSANLVANLTGVDLYPMLKKFVKTNLIPFLVSVIIYLGFSFFNPLNVSDSLVIDQLKENYIINFIILIPALAMLILSIFQLNVKKSMVVSIVLGSLIGVFVQGVSLADLLKTLVLGYQLGPDNPLAEIIKGGGLLSMAKPGFTIFVSCSMAGILEGMNVFSMINKYFKNIKTRSQALFTTGLVSVMTGAFGGNQSIAVVMTSEIMKELYEKENIGSYELATDIGNTAILFAAMIPWNIANLVPATTLSVDPLRIVPYAFYLYVVFIVNYFYLKYRDVSIRSSDNLQES